VSSLFKLIARWLLVPLFALVAMAQSAPHTDTVPIFSAGVGFVPSVEGGQTSLNTTIAPVILVPFGEKWLVESRATFEGDFERQNGSFVGPVEKQVDYLELDYVANKYLTVTAGRFITPFGIYSERLYPVWVRNLQTEPFILALEESSSNGFMLRGGVALNKSVVLNYATYFSALEKNQFLASRRKAGTRVGVFLPKQRMEVGFSLYRTLQGTHSNYYGTHFVWQPRQLPLDIRAEYAYWLAAQGYWIEPTFRLSSIQKLHALTSKTQLVGRFQQAFPGTKVKIRGSYEFPTVDATQAEFGINYYLMDGLRFSGSTGRQFSSAGNGNIWTVGMTYRFAIPLGHGGAQ
jgi:hypothetical protein